MTASVATFWNDPLYAQMDSMKVSWADLVSEDAPVPPALEDESNNKPKVLEYGWDFEFPELRLRKDIWEHFPVTVNPLGRGSDGAERHAIVWHRKNYEEWRNTRTVDYDEAMDYEEITLFRLFKCITVSKYWTVEDATADGQIAILRMNYVPKEEVAEEEPVAVTVAEDDSVDAWTVIPVVAKVAPSAPVKPRAPLFTRLNDIKEHFPVVWHKVEDVHTRTAVYALEIFGKKLIEMSRAAGKDVRGDVEGRLMSALRASPAWRVLKSEGREFCRLEMA
jgi:hypothetical protein